MKASKADSQVSAVKCFTGKDDRPGILTVSCRSVQHRYAILKGAKTSLGQTHLCQPQ